MGIQIRIRIPSVSKFIFSTNLAGSDPAPFINTKPQIALIRHFYTRSATVRIAHICHFSDLNSEHHTRIDLYAI
jgi:hypothetical protein